MRTRMEASTTTPRMSYSGEQHILAAIEHAELMLLDERCRIPMVRTCMLNSLQAYRKRLELLRRDHVLS